MPKRAKATNKEHRIYCKICGARLRRDSVGLLCPTRNCEWQHGVPEDEDSSTKNQRVETEE